MSGSRAIEQSQELQRNTGQTRLRGAFADSVSDYQHQRAAYEQAKQAYLQVERAGWSTPGWSEAQQRAGNALDEAKKALQGSSRIMGDLLLRLAPPGTPRAKVFDHYGNVPPDVAAQIADPRSRASFMTDLRKATREPQGPLPPAKPVWGHHDLE